MPDQPDKPIQPDNGGWTPTPREGEYYFDGPYMVFTEAYHLRRGSCCQSGCRHCPWGFRRKPEPSV